MGRSSCGSSREDRVAELLVSIIGCSFAGSDPTLARYPPTGSKEALDLIRGYA